MSHTPNGPMPPLARLLAFLAAAAIVVVLLIQLLGSSARIPPVVFGWAGLGMFLVACWAITGRLNPLFLAIGADGRVSKSQFQFLVWSMVAVFTYCWLATARSVAGNPTPVDDIPRNLLIAMGISVTTLVAAKGITESGIRAGTIAKQSIVATGNPKELVVADDGVSPDLASIQVLIWTTIAVVVYLVRVGATVGGYAICRAPDPCEFPDIDTALMFLMGLANGAYLFSKAMPSDTTRVSLMTPSSGAMR